MHLHEEYIRRHGLPIPVVLYSQNSQLLVVQDKPMNIASRWQVLSFEWTQPDWHPGRFVKRRLFPRYNSWPADSHGYRYYFAEDEHELRWEDYEEDVIRSIQMYKSESWRPVTDDIECELASWEMVLYMCDGWLAQNCSDDFFALVEQSLDQTLSLYDRQMAFARALGDLPDDIRELMACYVYPIASNRSPWMTRLFDESLLPISD